MNKTDMLTLFAYNDWANRRILTTAARLSDEQFRAPTEIAVRNLQDTLVHQLDVEWSWRLRLQGEPPEVWQQEELTAADFPTAASLAARWEVEAHDMCVYLESLTDMDLQVPTGPESGKQFPLWYYLMHILQHSAQSRADAATLLTQLGHSPGQLDFLDFADTMQT